jgi:hypothetical protein
MPNLTGQLKSSDTMQTLASLNDTPGHQLLLSVSHSRQTSSDSLFNNIHHSAWGTTDLHNGSGHQHGYFANEHADGDRSFGTYECNVSTVNGQLTMEGHWKFTNGTGQFAGISGNGTFKAQLTSPTTSEASFEGSYQVKSGIRAA